MHPKKITFIDEKGEIKLECKFNSIPLVDEKIIQKSIELFSDREPCIIHRSFVIKKLLFEIGDYFSNVNPRGEGQIVWESIPENIRDLICIGDDIIEIHLG